MLYIENYDLVAINKTWYNFSKRDFVFEYRIDGYQLFYKDRKNREGGGVMIYIKDALRTSELEFENIEGIDMIGITVNVSNIKLNIINVYRPPNTPAVTDINLYSKLGRFSR